jgi:hypothetical protein
MPSRSLRSAMRTMGLITALSNSARSPHTRASNDPSHQTADPLILEPILLIIIIQETLQPVVESRLPVYSVVVRQVRRQPQCRAKPKSVPPSKRVTAKSFKSTPRHLEDCSDRCFYVNRSTAYPWPRASLPYTLIPILQSPWTSSAKSIRPCWYVGRPPCSSPPADLFTQDSLPPTQAVNVLNDRMRHVAQLNTSIADWLQVRVPRGRTRHRG